MQPTLITLPSKTFLLGEYNVLFGGPAILVCTNPRFELKINLRDTSTKSRLEMTGIHPDSPAGNFILQNLSIFNPFSLTFLDPYKESGGFGASSAQFLSVYIFTQLLSNSFHNILDTIEYEKVLQVYRTVSYVGKGPKPSGADIVAQFNGGITYFAGLFNMEDTNAKMHWPFNDIGFILFKTPFKVNTHTHLKELNLNLCPYLTDITNKVQEAITCHKSSDFVKGITLYSYELQKLYLLHDNTKKILEKLNKMSYVLATKGCGALGADVIIVFTHQSDKEFIIDWAFHNNLKPIATDSDLSSGAIIR